MTILDERVAKARSRFRVELTGMQRLSHPHIVRVLDGSPDDSPPWLVMPWLRGGTLEKRLGALKGNAKQTLSIAHKLAGALAYAHEQRVVHRDLHPGNIMFEDNGWESVVIVDFGICRLLDDEAHPTVDGEFVGPEHFRAPENEGARKDEIDARCDCYSLGKLIYYMLSGGARLPRERHREALFSAPLQGALSRKLLLLLDEALAVPVTARLSMTEFAGKISSLLRSLERPAPAMRLADDQALDSIAVRERKAKEADERRRMIAARDKTALEDATATFRELALPFLEIAAEQLRERELQAHPMDVTDREKLQLRSPSASVKAVMGVRVQGQSLFHAMTFELVLAFDRSRSGTDDGYPLMLLVPVISDGPRSFCTFGEDGGLYSIGQGPRIVRTAARQPSPTLLTGEELRANELVEMTPEGFRLMVTPWFAAFVRELAKPRSTF